MPKSIITILLLLLLTLTFTFGCANKHTIGGAALGGIGGGIAGAQIGKGTGNIAAIIGGTLIGAALGGYVGSYLDRMDRQDKVTLNKTLEHQPTGQTVAWNNPDTNTAYAVTPTKTYMHQERYCREYQTEVVVGGNIEKAYGTACRKPDGQWEVVK